MLCESAVVEFSSKGETVALARDAHLSDDEAVAKMGHPDLGFSLSAYLGRSR